MTKRISRTITYVSLATLFVSSILILFVLYDHFIEQQFKQQESELSLCVIAAEAEGEKFLEKLEEDNYRLTWIDKDGTVLFDNEADISTMENHNGREEVKEAQLVGVGQSSRYSSTLGAKTIYSAIKLENGTILRIATKLITVWGLVFEIIPALLIIIILCVWLSYFIAKKVAKRTVEPINALNLDEPELSGSYEELNPLLKRIREQNTKISGQINDLNSKSQQMENLTSNVTDGIVLIDGKGKILSLNKKARKLLNCKKGEFYLDSYRNISYKDLVENAIMGKSDAISLEFDDSIYRFSASPIEGSCANFSVFIFITDITEEESMLKMRREFTANVSHELKTPLASIMGSAEIIASGIAKNEDIPHFATKIHSESQRLLKLIQDIIKISRLDEGQIGYEKAPVSLKKQWEIVEQQLKDKAQKQGVRLSGDCDELSIQGFESVIYEMVFNLCDNAISYNSIGGGVRVKVKEAEDFISLSVEDDGIGISQKDIPHIFERFYRVDKSHSKESGGTGLGLSIVKHGAAIHNAKIKVHSKLNNGTQIRIDFPKLK